MIAKSMNAAMMALSTLGALAIISPAQAFTVNQTSINDQQFNQLILDGDFSELFVAETRGGNGQTNGSREVGINQPYSLMGMAALTLYSLFLVPKANSTLLITIPMTCLTLS